VVTELLAKGAAFSILTVHEFLGEANIFNDTPFIKQDLGVFFLFYFSSIYA